MSDALTTLPERLRRLVLEATDKAEPPGGLGDDELLFGPDSRLDLDSLDALQLSMALQQAFGVRVPDSKETRRAFASIAHLAAHLVERLGLEPGAAAERRW